MQNVIEPRDKKLTETNLKSFQKHSKAMMFS